MGFFKTYLSLLVQKRKCFLLSKQNGNVEQNRKKQKTNKKYGKKMDFSGKDNGENTEIQQFKYSKMS